MSAEILTGHNHNLLRPTEVSSQLPSIPSEDNFTRLMKQSVNRYVQESLSSSTRTAYLSDLRHFELFGGSIPASPEDVAAYIAAYAGNLSVATLVRRVAAISKAHNALGISNPTKTELVRATLRGIKRIWTTAQKEAKPLMREDLFQTLSCMGGRVKDIRDRALLLIGFAGGFRRSELVALQIQDIENAGQGVIITVRRSKTDQAGVGRKLAIPYGRSQQCAVGALERWVELGEIKQGPIFRRIDRHGNVGEGPISGEAVSLVLRERLHDACIDPSGYSGHSLRAGFATSAAQAGIPAWQIRRQTGHSSDGMLYRYIRNGELFRDNPAGRLL